MSFRTPRRTDRRRFPHFFEPDVSAFLSATVWFTHTTSLMRRRVKTVEETAELDLRVAQIQIAFGVSFATALASSFKPTQTAQQVVASLRMETAAVGRCRAVAFFRCFGVLDVPTEPADAIAWCQEWAFRVRTLYIEQWPPISSDTADQRLPFNARKHAFLVDRHAIPATQLREAVEEHIAALIFNRV